VAAALALLKSNIPSLTYDEMRIALISGTTDVTPVGFDMYTGYGIIDRTKCLILVKMFYCPSLFLLTSYIKALQ
jgi:hypothetical protein